MKTLTPLRRVALIAFALSLPYFAVGCGDTTPPDITDDDGDGFAAEVDCDDTRADVNPNAIEVAYNGLDDDCSPRTPDDDLDGDGFDRVDDCDDDDENANVTLLGYADGDMDTYGAGPAMSFCGALGTGYVDNDDDCDDTSDEALPGGTEVPDDGLDNDCVGGDLVEDADGDGFTRIGATTGSADDCDDDEMGINPGATDDAGDDVDEDCSGDAFDQDGDGQDDVLGSDCNDMNPAVGPGASEIYDNGIDDDCNVATADDDPDLDDDGVDGLSAGGTDCDDLEPAVNPNQLEIPDDGLDNDCADGDLSALDDLGVYVDSSNASCSDAGSTSSRAAPFCTMSHALANVTDGDVIYVAGGPYAMLQPSNDISIHGAYSSSWGRDLQNRTVLTGDSSTAPLDIRNGASVTISGTHMESIVNGHASGINLFNQSSVIAYDMTFDLRSTCDALAVRVSDSTATLRRVEATIEGNCSANYGVYVSAFSAASMATVQESSFTITGDTGAIGLRVRGGGSLTADDVDLMITATSNTGRGVHADEAGTVMLDDVRATVSAGGTAYGAQLTDTTGITVRGGRYDAMSGATTVGLAIEGTMTGAGATVEDAEFRAGNATASATGASIAADGVTLRRTTIRSFDAMGGSSFGLLTTGDDLVAEDMTLASAAAMVLSAGAYLLGDGATLDDSDVICGAGALGSYGVASAGASFVMVDTLIIPGPADFTAGVRIEGGSATLTHVGAYGGPGTNASVGLEVTSGATSVLAVNSVFTSGSSMTKATAVDAGIAAVTLRNNALVLSEAGAVLLEDAGDSTYVNLADVNSMTWGGTGVMNIVATALDFVDLSMGVLRPSATSSLLDAGVDVGTLGLTLSAAAMTALASDTDGDTRASWDIGIDEVP